MKKRTILKFVNLEPRKILVWIVLLAIFSPFFVAIFSVMMDIQIGEELPEFIVTIFDNSFFLNLFRVSWILSVPIMFLFEKVISILGYNFFPTKIFLINLSGLIFLLFYTYFLCCLAIFVWDKIIIRKVRKTP